jgi:RHS repeat-associated protein
VRIDAPAGAGEKIRRVTRFTVDASGTPGRNADGTPARVVDAKGQTSVYSYDEQGRLRGIDYLGTDGVVDSSRAYTLDANGNMTGAVEKERDPATGALVVVGGTTWTYDENNRVTGESRTQNGVTKSAGYAYHPASGLMTSMTTFGGQAVAYAYDASLRLKSQTDPNDGGRVINYDYDARSRLIATVYPSGVRQAVSYDQAGRVAELRLVNSNATVLQSFKYDYGFDPTGARTAEYAKGNVVGFTETTAGLADASVSYRYDTYNRLTSAVRTGQDPFDQAYAYDLNNNRTSVRDGATTTAATYDDANQMLTQGSKSYGYDPNGNLTKIEEGQLGTSAYTVKTLSYNEANQWTAASWQTQGVAGPVSLAFEYDALGRRTSRTVGTGRTDYWYDASGMALETGAANATYLRTPKGRLLSSSAGGAVQDYATDRLGSVTATTNASGGATSTYRYDPWGEAIGSGGTGYNPYRYTGTYRDSQTGLYQMGARYYQSGTGRFTQQDPLGRSVYEANRYAYAGCNPTNATDPTGLSPSWGCALALAGLLLDVFQVVAGISALAGSVTGIVAFLATYFAGVVIDTLSIAEQVASDPTVEGIAWETYGLMWDLYSSFFTAGILDFIGIGQDLIDIDMSC